MQRAHFSGLAFCLSALLAAVQPLPALSASNYDSSDVSPAVVIGFVGGYVKHNNAIHAEVQLAEHLREEYPSGVHIEAFENHRGKQALQEILKLLDTDHDGSLSPSEKQQARIILYGHSWGASESLHLARSLGRDGIPVLLTIQVDSVAKRGQNDAVIPPNVAQAVNFYQTNGFVHGQKSIEAADPSRTHIIGNFRFDYRQHPINCAQYPWWDRYLARPHTEIECDPSVWAKVESYIRSSLLPIIPSAGAASWQIQHQNKDREIRASFDLTRQLCAGFAAVVRPDWPDIALVQ
jgi:hypothetical protein